MLSIFTIVARNFLSLALTLGDSIKKHHPEAEFIIVVVDGLLEIENTALRHNVIAAEEIVKEGFKDLAFKYDITEFCTSIKPQVFNYFLNKHCGKVIYFDPDIILYDRIDPILQALDNKTICITPHLVDCFIKEENHYPEYHHLWEGIYNFGFCGVRDSITTRKFIDWWTERLLTYCYSDHQDGLHTDQKWADYLPAFFGDDLAILRHYGANVSHWNLRERKIKEVEGKIRANDVPLLFFHFSGFDFYGTGLVKRGTVDISAKDISSDLEKLASEYREAVKENGFEKFIQKKYLFNFFCDGSVITPLHRRLYRENGIVMNDPFIDFFHVLMDKKLIDNNPSAILGYSQKTIPSVNGKLRLARALCKIFISLFGVRRYCFMIRGFRYLGRYENHLFLIKNK